MRIVSVNFFHTETKNKNEKEICEKGRGIPVFWKPWQNHVVNCGEMKLFKILGLNAEL